MTVYLILVASKKKRFRESPFPVYWIEVFNIADQKWIPVDPLVLKLIEKPSKFEPPASDIQNNMSYVIAVDEDGFIKDATRRYVHAYNARTRRYRIEATRNGHQWWERIERMYRDPLPQDRNQVEDSELAAKEAREPMPRSIVEFKNHPYYALERHLHQNEVLHPKRQVGTVSAGTNRQLEPVFRRNDVHIVRSPDAWFRLGRQVKLGEEPLKYLEPKKAQKPGQQDDSGDEDTAMLGIAASTPLYAIYQTQEYLPPPIMHGIVPKNIYGNIDIYTPSMIPAGGVWINHPFAVGAAKLLAIDWVDAVTGFEFRGRTGTAVMKGIVIAGEYHEAAIETIKAFQHAIEQEEVSKRTAQVLYTWKRFLIGLRIRERIKSYHVEGEDLEAAAQTSPNDTDSASEYNPDEVAGGGFLPSEAITATASDVDMDMDIPNPIPLPSFTPLESDPPSKPLQDSRLPIISTWGKALPILNPIYPQPQQPQPITPEGEYGEGGFIPEYAGEFGDIIGGGGFFIDNDIDNDNGNGNSNSNSNYNEAGGFFISDSADAGIDAGMQIDGPARSDADPDADIDNNNNNNGKESKEVEPYIENDEAKKIPTSPLSPGNISETNTDTDTDTQSIASLLSHDPDDDDAEPEWL